MTVIDILTLFPQALKPFFKQSLIGRAQKNSRVKVNLINLRDFAADRRQTTDDRPFGGGPGMVLKVEPIARALRRLKKDGSHTILLSASGAKFNQKKAQKLARKKHLIIICGHYEGVDQRVADYYADEEISIGDYILSGGESAALVLADAVIRLVPKVLSNPDSLTNESFQDDCLSYPQYTRPEVWEGQAVPKILLSGDHQKIRDWRRREALEKTRKIRSDLLP